MVFLADARAKRRSRPSNRWAFNEVAELARLYRAKYERGGQMASPTGQLIWRSAISCAE